MFKFIKNLIKSNNEKHEEVRKEQQELLASIKTKIEEVEKLDLDWFDIDSLREIEDILSCIL